MCADRARAHLLVRDRYRTRSGQKAGVPTVRTLGQRRGVVGKKGGLADQCDWALEGGGRQGELGCGAQPWQEECHGHPVKAHT